MTLDSKILARLEQYHKTKQYRKALCLLKDLSSKNSALNSTLNSDEETLIKQQIQSFRYELWKKKLVSFQIWISLESMRKFYWIALVSLGFFFFLNCFLLGT